MKTALIILFLVNAILGILNSISAYSDGNISACRGWGCAAAFALLLILNELSKA